MVCDSKSDVCSAASPVTERGAEGRRAQGGDGAPTAAMRFRIKAAACVLERGRLPSTGCDPGRLSTRSCVAALCYGAWRESGCDAEPSRSERRGSESSLTVHALSSFTEFAFTAVAPLLPTMTTVGSGVTIGSPAISSAGGGRSGLEGPRAPCCRRVEIDMQLDGSPEKVRRFSRRDRQCGGERLDRIRAFRREQCCKRGAVRRSA